VNNLRKAAEQALDFVTSTQWGKRDYMDYGCYVDAFVLADALRAALAEPEPEEIADAPRLYDENKRLREANAELLEALDTLAVVVGLTPVAGNKAALQEAFDLARAAIAKAEEVQT
jgi:hypothetical protein